MSRLQHRPRLAATLAAAAAFLLAAVRINPGLVDSALPDGPGLTLDEPLYVLQGEYLFDSFCRHGPLLWTPGPAAEVFGSREYLPDHPPLGRLFLISAHESLRWAIGGTMGSPVNITAARLGSCIAFAIAVWLLYRFSESKFGTTTAVAAVIAIMLMPRVVGHARIAALEATTMLAWLAACVPLWTWWTRASPPQSRQCAVAGFLLGLLMLTKIQGILLPPIIILWTFWKFRSAAIRPLLIWGITGFVIFFVGWPWLWLDPVAHLTEYIAGTTQRPTLYTWYLGQRYADRLVPWHYPFVMFFATCPAVVLLFLVKRIRRRQIGSTDSLILITAVWPLIVFALPGTPVYDGCRLFLIIMPAVALLAGRGFALQLQSCAASRRRRWILLAAGLSLLSVPDVLSPFALSSYSSLVGWAPGAQRLGLETSYWGDGLNAPFWEQMPPDSTVYVAPVCHQLQLHAMQNFVPVVSERRLRLVPFQYDPLKEKGFILLIYRRADLRPALTTLPAGASIVAETQYQNVTLCRTVDTRRHTWATIAPWPDQHTSNGQ